MRVDRGHVHCRLRNRRRERCRKHSVRGRIRCVETSPRMFAVLGRVDLVFPSSCTTFRNLSDRRRRCKYDILQNCDRGIPRPEHCICPPDVHNARLTYYVTRKNYQM